MTQILRIAMSIALAASLSGCVFYGHPYHRSWHAPFHGAPGYWR